MKTGNLDSGLFIFVLNSVIRNFCIETRLNCERILIIVGKLSLMTLFLLFELALHFGEFFPLGLRIGNRKFLVFVIGNLILVIGRVFEVFLVIHFIETYFIGYFCRLNVNFGLQ